MNVQQENCYLWMDQSIPEEERTMNVLCEKCHLKYPGLGWFWEGSRLGYGPFEFICNKCGHIVHSVHTTSSDVKQNQDKNEKK